MKTYLGTTLRSIKEVYYAGHSLKALYAGVHPLWSADPDATIKELFAGGKQGVWYDPSDKSTMFQDVAGTVPVTKDGDPVGLRLDKSQGLTLGEELVATIPTPEIQNNDGSSGVWISATNTMSNTQVGARSNYPRFRFLLGNLSDSKTYKLKLKINPPVGVLDKIIAFNTSLTGVDLIMDSEGFYNYIGKLSSTSLTFAVFTNGTQVWSGFTLVSLSVRELKGNHATQSVSAARPTYKKDTTKSWLYHDKVDDKMSVVLPSMAATVVAATDDGVTINYPVSIPSGAYTLTNNSTLGRDYGRLIIDKELSASEKAQVTAYFNTKRGV